MDHRSAIIDYIKTCPDSVDKDDLFCPGIPCTYNVKCALSTIESWCDPEDPELVCPRIHEGFVSYFTKCKHPWLNKLGQMIKTIE